MYAEVYGKQRQTRRVSIRGDCPNCNEHYEDQETLGIVGKDKESMDTAKCPNCEEWEIFDYVEDYPVMSCGHDVFDYWLERIGNKVIVVYNCKEGHTSEAEVGTIPRPENLTYTTEE